MKSYGCIDEQIAAAITKDFKNGYISDVYDTCVDITFPTDLGDYTLGAFCHYCGADLNRPILGKIDYEGDNEHVDFPEDTFTQEERDFIQGLLDAWGFTPFWFNSIQFDKDEL